MGYGAMTVINLLKSLRVAATKPRAILDALLNPDSLGLGMFLGGFAALFKVNVISGSCIC